MFTRSALVLLFGVLSLPGLSGCKSFYSDTYSYKKNGFKAPVTKSAEVKEPTLTPQQIEALSGGAAPEGIPAAPAGELPGAVPAVPGLPEAAPAPAPGAAPVPAVPGLN